MAPGPLTRLRELRTLPELSRVALKDWREMTGAMLVWIEFSEGFRASIDASFPEWQPASRDGRVRERLVDVVTALVSPVELEALDLLSLDESDYDDFTRVGLRCPPGCLVSLRVKAHNPHSGRKPSQGAEALRSRRRRREGRSTTLPPVSADERAERRGRLYCRLEHDDPEWPDWAPRVGAKKILAVASKAWGGGMGSYRDVARALNKAGLQTLGSGSAFSGSNVKDVLIAVELVEGSA
jgi:hypothetical protein